MKSLKKLQIISLLILSMFACTNVVLANNIAVSNIKIHGKNVSSHYQMVRFDISWENSWRVSNNQNNWDAAWVFIKFRKNGSQNWQHATLNYIDGTPATDGHTPASGATINAGSDGKGAYVYRAADGVGNVNFQQNSVRWNYGVDGVQDGDSVSVCVFAVEMVYVPQGQFYLGSGANEYYNFYNYPNVANPYLVTSEAAITVGSAANNLYCNGGGISGGTIPAAFPKGYNAFYCMKYEISQGQYAEFLNYIAASQASNRYPNSNGNYRHTISGTHPNYTASAPNRACNYIDIVDGMAYADWSGMRPMSELEFEKACRGANQLPVPAEYSFGSNNANSLTAVQNDGTDTESGNAGSNISNYNSGIQLLVRCGAFANTGTNRQQSGASYYGIMEMSGNVLESCIMATYNQGRSNFSNTNGDGYLSATGTSNVSQWPVDMYYGTGYRGGSIADNLQYCTVSDRWYNVRGNTARTYYTGFRAVRSANN